MPTSRRALITGGLGMVAGCSVGPAAPGSQLSREPSAATAGTATPTSAEQPSKQPAEQPWRAKLMSFNVLSGIVTGADYESAVVDDEVTLGRRAPVIAKWISTAGPDVIGIQENEAHRPAELPLRAFGPLLPDYVQVLPELEVPLLVRDAAYEVDDSDSLVLSREFYLRQLTWVWLTHRSTGRRLLVANTHLEPYRRLEHARARSAQVDRVIAQLRRLNPKWATPTVLLGDLNTPADENRAVFRDPLVKLPKAGLTDAALVAAKDISEVKHAATVNRFGGLVDGTWRYRAIQTDGRSYDYAFVSDGLKVRTWQVVTGPGVRRIGGHPFFADGPMPSDHCPVQIEVTDRG